MPVIYPSCQMSQASLKALSLWHQLRLASLKENKTGLLHITQTERWQNGNLGNPFFPLWASTFRLTDHIGEGYISAPDLASDLGVLLGRHFNATSHIKKVCSQSCYHLKNISRIRNVLSRRWQKLECTLSLLQGQSTETAWYMNFLIRQSASFSDCRTRLLDLSREPDSSITFILSSGSFTGWQCPGTFPYSLPVRYVAFHQITLQAYIEALCRCSHFEFCGRELADCASVKAQIIWWEMVAQMATTPWKFFIKISKYWLCDCF